MDESPTPSDFGALVHRVDRVEAAVQKVADAVAENTALTQDIKDAQTFARVGKRVVVFFAAAAIGLGGVLNSWTHIVTWVRELGKH